MSERVRILGWRHGSRIDVPQDFAAIPDVVADPAVLVWIDLVDPNPDDLAEMAHCLQLDPHAIEDATAPDERPKATRARDHTFFLAYATSLGPAGVGDDLHDSRLRTDRIAAFVLPSALVTIRAAGGFDTTAVERRWSEDPQLLSHGVGSLVHGLLDVIVDGHFATIQALDDTAETLEDVLFERDGTSRREIQQRVYRLRKELVQLRRVVLPMREVVTTLIRYRAEQDPDRALDGYFSDLYDHVMRATEWTESLRDVISTIFETNLSLQDAHLNVVMKKLAGWAAVIAVPTAVTGWFGMNVPYPGSGTMPGFYVSVALVVVGTLGMFTLLKRSDWI